MEPLEQRVVDLQLTVNTGLAEVKGSLNTDMAEVKGALAVILDGQANDRKHLAEQEARTKVEFERLAAERAIERVAQERKDLDQETRLRAVDPLPQLVANLTAAQAATTAIVTGMRLHQAKWAGGGVVASLIVSTLAGYLLYK